MIEQAYTQDEALGLVVWCHDDQAGPYQPVPHAGIGWQSVGEPSRQLPEYIWQGTSKLLTLFQPANSRGRVQGVTSCRPNAVLHPWTKGKLSAILTHLPPMTQATDPLTMAAAWHPWQAGLRVRVTLLAMLPALCMLLMLDSLASYKTVHFVLWLVANSLMAPHTPEQFLAPDRLGDVAHSWYACVGWTMSCLSAADYPQSGDGRRSLEAGTNAFCLWWQSGSPTLPCSPTSLSARRLWRLHQPAEPAPTIQTILMA